jgi:isoamylase
MLLAGKEFSHTQKGSNNAYCQDNECTWLNWKLCEEQLTFHAFVRAVIQLQRTQPVFQRCKFLLGRPIRSEGILDISGFKPSGEEMTEEAWQTGHACCLGSRWATDLIAEADEKGEPVVGDTILLLLNPHHEASSLTMPARKETSSGNASSRPPSGPSRQHRRRASSHIPCRADQWRCCTRRDRPTTHGNPG